MNSSEQDRGHSARQLIGWTVRAAAHMLGVAFVAAVLFIPFSSPGALEAMWMSAHHTEFVHMSWSEVALHLALSASLWTLLVLMLAILRGRKKPVKRLMNVQSGSVLTELLIILPVFFLLTFGISQLAINNVAGLLANTATFQAGRAMWLWSSEAEANRAGVNSATAREKARVQAAAVLTPVSPGEFFQNPFGLSEEAEQMRAILLGSQIPIPSQDAGGPAKTMAAGFLAGANMSYLPYTDTAFTRALDDSSWRQRTVRKFTFAYKATQVERVTSGGKIGARVTYQHNQVFPLVGALFGDHATVSGRPGYYSTLEREFTMPTQIPPNARTP